MFGPRQEHQRRIHQADDRDLADFDADIEPEQAHHQAGARQVHFTQHGGKAEAMNQAEEKSEPPAVARVFDPQVFDSNIDDRAGDVRSLPCAPFERLDVARGRCAAGFFSQRLVLWWNGAERRAIDDLDRRCARSSRR